MSSWDGIDEFLAVVETGSFTAAAEALSASKAYVSKTVNELEARLGAQLIVRTTRRLSLTAAGELFLDRCRSLRGQLGDTERAMAEFQTKPMGRLRIALSDTFGTDFMSALLADFSYLHRDISIEPIVYLREADLNQAHFDLAIRYGPLESSSAQARLFGYTSYCLCAAPEYVAQHGWPSSPKDLTQHNCLSNVSGHFEFNGGVRVKVGGNWTSNSGIALRSATRRGLGLSQLPISVVRRELAEGRIIPLLEEWSYYDQEVRAVFPPGIIPSATRAFLDYLTSHVGMNKARPTADWLQRLADRLDR
jgi:DNA-binding transcriptional LysR family regulator